MALNACQYRHRIVHCSIAGPNAARASTQEQPQNAVILADSRTQKFVEWCRDSLRVESSKLRPATFKGLRGMAAAEGGIKADDLIISIPRLASITLAPGARCPCPAFVAPDYWRAQPWFVQMGIMLLHEQRLGEASRLSRYIEQLPRSFDAPVLWTPQQLQQLQCPHTIQQVQLQQQEWAGLHRQLLASGLQPGQATVTSEQFLWALCAVRSRTFSGPYIGSSLADRLRLAALVGGLSVANVVLGLADVQRTLSAALAVLLFNLLYELILSRSLKQHALCPLVDFINHSSASKSEVSLDYFSDRYSVQAGRDYSMGEEVFISYGGNQTNDSLLQYYGFTEPDLPGDCYCMTRMMAWLEAEQGPVAPWRLDALRQAGLMEAVSSVTLVRKGFPAESLHALRFLLAPDEEARNTALGGLASWQQAGSPEQEQRLALLLVAACEKELEALGTSLEQDLSQLALLRSARQPTAAEARIALEYRIEKKKVLRDCLAALRG
ncbi:hypothetical protein V8C86DRAFT_2679007 [Haematococcus lacustris]